MLPKVLRRITPALTAKLMTSLEQRNQQFDPLAAKFREEVLESRLLPLLREEVWPIVVEHGTPAVDLIGRQLWERAPLFDLAWRAAYDRVISEKPIKLESRWKDFVEEEAIPILQQNEALIQSTMDGIIRDIAASAAVRTDLREAARAILEDPLAKDLMTQVLRDVFLENEALLEVWDEIQQDPELVQHWLNLNAELQKFLAPAVNLLVYDDGDRDTINPDLAKLLRILLLREDLNFVFLELGDGPGMEFGAELIGIQES